MDSDRGGGGGRRVNSNNRGRSGSYSHGRRGIGKTQVWKAKSPASVSQQSGQDQTDSNHVGVSELAKSSPATAASSTEKLNCMSYPKHGQSDGRKGQIIGEKSGDGQHGKQIWQLSSPDCVSENSEYHSAYSSLSGTPELAKESPDLVTSSAEKMKSSCKDTSSSTESFGKLEEKRDQMNKNQTVDLAGNLSVSLDEANILCPLDVSGQSIKSGTNSMNINSPWNPTTNRNTEQSTVAPFDICLKKSGPPLLKLSLLAQNRERRKEKDRSLEGTKGHHIRPGMVLLKNYLSCDEQVSILKKCRDLGLGPGGFYQPGYSDEVLLRLKMMCLGKNWNPQTSMYESRRSIDGAIPPIIPDEFNHLVKRAIEDSHAVIRKDPKASRVETILPFMSPDICIVNFYSQTGKLGLHKDRDESPESLGKCLPVVSFSIGDSAIFAYSDVNNVDQADEVVLESGDALIFGGKSRHIFHGVTAIITDTAPKALLEETNLRSGRLNLTFRQY